LEPEFTDGESEYSGELKGLAARTLRAEKRMSNEDLIATELAWAVTSEPLQKIRHAAESVMLLNPNEKRQAHISGEEVEDAGMLHELALDLLGVYVHSLTDKYGVTTDLYASIPWSFPRKDASKWLGGWAQDLDCCHWEINREAELSKIENKFERMWATTQEKIPVPTARTFVARFAAYALPRVIIYMTKVVRLISPDSYRQALMIMQGGKHGKTA